MAMTTTSLDERRISLKLECVEEGARNYANHGEVLHERHAASDTRVVAGRTDSRSIPATYETTADPRN